MPGRARPERPLPTHPPPPSPPHHHYHSQGAGLRGDLARHASSAGLGVATFFAEDALAERGLPGVHAVWHCLAAYATHAAGGLVLHKELQARRAVARSTRRSDMHSSAASLYGMPCTPKPAKSGA